ncbi:MAG TPA: sugar phosphate isomerase/epimerase family protein, partial [Clostridia bacterium]|nr:sugar phosphate isomerase/epimerase family protein [Clostridia bacterium]
DARVLVLHPEYLEDGSYDRARIALACDIAREYGLRLALETGIPDASGHKPDYRSLIDLVDEIGRPDVGINIDSGHLYFRDRQDVQTVIREVGPRLFTLHLHDNYGLRDDHLMPGLGGIDWREVLRALRESPYNGPIMMEMTDQGKEHRSIPQLGSIGIEQEIAGASGWLRHLWNTL